MKIVSRPEIRERIIGANLVRFAHTDDWVVLTFDNGCALRITPQHLPISGLTFLEYTLTTKESR